MAICPNCNQQIDNDSYFCEHCGTKLYACPKCHTIGKGEGKRCGQCGTKLVEASSIGQAAVPQPAQQPSAPQPAQQQYVPQGNNAATSQAPITDAAVSIPQGTGTQNPYGGAQIPYSGPQGSQPQGTAVSPPAMPTSLYCDAMNIRLQLFDGALIGRTTGDYVQQLSVCKYISGRHAQINMTPNGWTITDLGSTNGTKVNGNPCVPTLPFALGSIVRIGNFYNFRAE